MSLLYYFIFTLQVLIFIILFRIYDVKFRSTFYSAVSNEALIHTRYMSRAIKQKYGLCWKKVTESQSGRKMGKLNSQLKYNVVSKNRIEKNRISISIEERKSLRRGPSPSLRHQKVVTWSYVYVRKIIIFPPKSFPTPLWLISVILPSTELPKSENWPSTLPQSVTMASTSDSSLPSHMA